MNSKLMLDNLQNIKINPVWAFSDKTKKDTNYITHGYHRYPAKFIPQLAHKLILEYTKKGELVVDLFGGCGTTLVEAKVLGRPSISTDINPTAVLIAKAKQTAIEPIKLTSSIFKIKERIASYNNKLKINTPDHERIDYWFKDEQKRKLAFLIEKINKEENTKVRTFFYCGFSNILKNCSIWLQKSNKPMRDFNKILPDPFAIFLRQINAMSKGNNEFYSILKDRKYNVNSFVYKRDARNTKIKPKSVSLIVTSPPYVTSYQYADLHQLSALWLRYASNLDEFRETFIGRLSKKEKNITSTSKLADEISKKLVENNSKKLAKDVALYFFEMNKVFEEMKRILKKGGRACIVIGDTKLRGVEIKNSQVFIEQFQKLGFKLDKVIKREIPSKNLPQIRDVTTGKFTSKSNYQKVLSYPTEFILVFKK